jgi:hypothetical protein
VNAEQPGMPSLLLDFSGLVMTEAEANGFPKYFGAITRGIHEFDPLDRMLVGKEDFEDLTMQHIDITSEPHIRAALVEKWAKNTEFGANSVWVSNEVCRKDDVVAFANMFPDSGYRSFPESMDVLNIHGPTRWPFPQSVFHPIGPKV